MVLSERLIHISHLVTEGNRLADVGTDHAFVPIYLVREGRIPSAIAMDINKGPLRRAEEHIRDADLADKISTRLSDGLEALKPGEADTVLIAGMGGALTVRILENGKALLEKNINGGIRELVLQPQSEVMKVRRFLEKNGWMISREDMVLEDGKFYPMMQCRPGAMSLTDDEALFGPLLLKERHPRLREYLVRLSGICERNLEALNNSASKRAGEREAEIKRRLDDAREILSRWA